MPSLETQAVEDRNNLKVEHERVEASIAASTAASRPGGDNCSWTHALLFSGACTEVGGHSGSELETSGHSASSG